MKRQNLIAILGLFALFIVAFSSGRVIAPANAQGVAGSVCIMTNSPSGNQVIAYSRAPNRTLTWKANYATNGLGISGLTGSNQGGLVLSEDGRWLFFVNAGSNEISVFSVNHKGLSFTDKTSSQGTMPISATVNGHSSTCSMQAEPRARVASQASVLATTANSPQYPAPYSH